jgi:argininosuccinate synthase
MENVLKIILTLSVSAERVFQAIEAIKYAQLVQVPLLTGSTGAGNQIRFDLIFQLSLEIKSLLPLDLKLSRQEEVDYLSKTECIFLGKSQYSINKDFGQASEEKKP